MYFLDTNTCIYLINKRPQWVIGKIDNLLPEDIKIPSVVLGELEYGASKSKRREQNRKAIADFISAFEIIPFAKKDTETYGVLRAELERRGEIIGPYDLQIAAQALSRGAILVTNNTREFQHIKDLHLENWLQKP
jgi:tRNA(fMet)-specific endonuclease VapC